MIAKVSVLAMVLAITLAVAALVLAGTVFATAKPIPGYPDFTINNRGS